MFYLGYCFDDRPALRRGEVLDTTPSHPNLLALSAFVEDLESLSGSHTKSRNQPTHLLAKKRKEEERT
ncbi:unnamed protein product [Cuscuta campestris]|uniref:Uncharacterized protein n=1 Tax=Cuscuta campestris TaxID=132261 RepID=A0A484NAS2_9ASTE|nr:unnamed protein product [Cuscuta campestris]